MQALLRLWALCNGGLKAGPDNARSSSLHLGLLPGPLRLLSDGRIDVIGARGLTVKVMP
jgi:hypothetical protein